MKNEKVDEKTMNLLKTGEFREELNTIVKLSVQQYVTEILDVTFNEEKFFDSMHKFFKLHFKEYLDDTLLEKELEQKKKDEKKWLTFKEFSLEYNKSRATVDRWSKKGIISKKTIEGTVYFSRPKMKKT